MKAHHTHRLGTQVISALSSLKMENPLLAIGDMDMEDPLGVVVGTVPKLPEQAI